MDDEASPPWPQQTPASRDLIQQLLPTCQRCRRLRRKCDTRLPDCRLCQKAGVECTLFDHALQQSLPRAYVESLLTRFEHLKAVRDSVAPSPVQNATAKLADAAPAAREQLLNSSPTVASGRHASPSVASPVPFYCSETFDKHFVISAAAGRSRFFGASSVFSLTVEVLQQASKMGIISSDYVPAPLVLDHEPDPTQRAALNISYDAPCRPETVRELCRYFFVSSNTLYGIVDESSAMNDINTYVSIKNRLPCRPEDLHGLEAHQFFRVSMMSAISCATKARYHSSYGMQAMAHYNDALPCVEEVTSEVSPASLQALLLLTIFCLFYPRHGDIWKLLDYACRLSVELGYHTEQPLEIETETQRKLRRSTFWGLYAIERIVGQLFGRASDLPEPIITTEYPSVVLVGDEVDRATFQPISIAHHYRLVYLRSEIFRDTYLPATSPNFGLEWYKDRYDTLSSWRNELEVSEDLAGVATVTCDVGYNSTICFLLQPLMFRAIKAIEAAGDGMGSVSPVPQDNYWSACALIRTYEKVVRAPESGPLGHYPMTFLSAHYIYLAGLTIMAHALLALDGRVATLKPLGELGELGGEIEKRSIDFSNLFETSSSCLVLLSWCAERWQGMEGMQDVYKRLADKVIPAMMRKGIVT